jgi:hypothetical protein
VKGSQKEILDVKFHNIRPLGKPRTRWEDDFQRDTSQVLGIGGWRRQRRMAASNGVGQGPEGAVAP